MDGCLPFFSCALSCSSPSALVGHFHVLYSLQPQHSFVPDICLDMVAQLAEDKGGVMRAEKNAELARNLQLRNEAAARHHAACASLQTPPSLSKAGQPALLLH